MAGFLWKYSKERVGLIWRLTISTTRRRYGGGQIPEWWDEEISAKYLNGAHAGESVKVYRDRSGESTEKIIMIVEIREGSLIAVFKNETLCMYVLIIAGSIIQLAPDFEGPVTQYIQEGLSPEWLLAQEGCGPEG